MTDILTEHQVAEMVLEILCDEACWMQGDFSDSHGRYCMAGAAQRAATDSWRSCSGWRYCMAGAAQRAATDSWRSCSGFLRSCAEIIREQYPERFQRDACSGFTVAWFNDHEDTTYPDIRTVIEKVIAG